MNKNINTYYLSWLGLSSSFSSSSSTQSPRSSYLSLSCQSVCLCGLCFQRFSFAFILFIRFVDDYQKRCSAQSKQFTLSIICNLLFQLLKILDNTSNSINSGLDSIRLSLVQDARATERETIGNKKEHQHQQSGIERKIAHSIRCHLIYHHYGEVMYAAW